jgi:anti-anti-sigma regulatory factor
MLRAREHAAKSDGSVRLVKVDDMVRKILEMTRLDGVFQAAESVEDAVRSLR